MFKVEVLEFRGLRFTVYKVRRGTSLIRNCHPPKEHRRTLGIGLL